MKQNIKNLVKVVGPFLTGVVLVLSPTHMSDAHAQNSPKGDVRNVSSDLREQVTATFGDPASMKFDNAAFTDLGNGGFKISESSEHTTKTVIYTQDKDQGESFSISLENTGGAGNVKEYKQAFVQNCLDFVDGGPSHTASMQTGFDFGPSTVDGVAFSLEELRSLVKNAQEVVINPSQSPGPQNKFSNKLGPSPQ